MYTQRKENAKVNTKKVVETGTALLLSVSILTTTLGWSNLTQVARNEAKDIVANPGGRLHDDFDGKNKDIYVENFTDPENGQEVYARIRLREYMELGAEAGDPDAEGYAAEPLVAGTKIDDPSTWPVYTLGTAEDRAFAEYWTWDNDGGSTVYMPTFNVNKDSIEADINGTLEGTTVGDDVYYDDYVAYAVGDKVTGDEIYDADKNDIDEGESAVEGTNIKTVEDVEHTAKETLGATVIAMKDWDGTPGAFWVYDEDGWAYWAQPIEPGTATGLLLDEITHDEIDDSWYYAINVEAQFITADGVGFEDNTGFYADDETVSDKAKALLKAIGVNFDWKGTVTVSAAEDSVMWGETLTMSAGVAVDKVETPDQAVKWSVSGNTSDDTSIDESTGVLTVGADETATSLTVTATSETYGLVGEKEVSIDWPLLKNLTINEIADRAGSTQKVKIGDDEFYILDVDGSSVLLLRTTSIKICRFDDDSNIYEGSEIESVVDAYAESMNAVDDHVIYGKLLDAYEIIFGYGPNWVHTFTWNTAVLANGEYWWLSSPGDIAEVPGMSLLVDTEGEVMCTSYANYERVGVRPALIYNVVPEMKNLSAEQVKSMAGTTEVVRIADEIFNVLTVNDGKALLLRTACIGKMAFDDGSNIYEGSAIQSFVNSYADALNSYDSNVISATLLSYDDIFSTSGDLTLDAIDWNVDVKINGEFWWTRSVSDEDLTGVAVVLTDEDGVGSAQITDSSHGGVRPAVIYDLGA